MTKIRMLIILDQPCLLYKDTIEKSLITLREDYRISTNNELDLTWQYEKFFAEDLIDDWEEYNTQKDLGISRAWISQKTKELKEKYQYTIDCVAFVIDKTNWKSPTTAGWNLGGFYSSYQIQLIKGNDYERGLYLRFSMELAHALDDFIFDALGVNLDVRLGFDYDNGAIHGEHPPYKVFEYRPIIGEIKGLLIDTFKRRESVTLLFTLVGLYRKLILLLTKKNEPIYEN